MMISAMMSLIGSLPGTFVPPPGRMKPASAFRLYRFAPSAPATSQSESNGPHRATASPDSPLLAKRMTFERETAGGCRSHMSPREHDLEARPIAGLVECRRPEIEISKVDIVRRCGYRNLSKGLRRLDANYIDDLQKTARVAPGRSYPDLFVLR